MGGKGILITGVAVSGLGEGAFFMSMPHYRNEIRNKLGFDAYPGTLNVKTDEKQIMHLKKLTPMTIEGYSSGNKTFRGASCYNAKIKNINGAVIIPDISKHKDVIEFIAPIQLKSELNIKDGDKII